MNSQNISKSLLSNKNDIKRTRTDKTNKILKYNDDKSEGEIPNSQILNTLVRKQGKMSVKNKKHDYDNYNNIITDYIY